MAVEDDRDEDEGFADNVKDVVITGADDAGLEGSVVSEEGSGEM